MKIIPSNDITLNSEERILTASLGGPNELLLLLSSGSVIRYNIKQQEKQHLFSVKNRGNYSDGGFDINAPSTIYSLKSIVVIVNDYKRHGYVHYPGKYSSLHLWREDYHADISCFPIELFESEAGVPHLIYGVAWNHIQIMNLDTRQILTASKSLIEEGAEERHLNFYKNHIEENKLPWPRPYDYFFGKLEISPNKKAFLSAGWNWGSNDAYNIYGVEDFIKNTQISELNIGAWEHTNRAVCWIDDHRVAITYHPFEEGEENCTEDSPHEINIYNIKGGKSQIEKRIKINGLDLQNSTLNFLEDAKIIILFSDTIGVLLLSLEGEILLHDSEMRQNSYYSEFNVFLSHDDKTVSLHQIYRGD